MKKIVLVSAILATLSAQARADTLPDELVNDLPVTLKEVRKNSEETFNAFAGPNGSPISKEQFVSTQLPEKLGPSGKHPVLLSNLFGVLDGNGDGNLTRAEWNQQIEKDLSFADADGDGRITVKELANARENMGIGDALGMLF